MWIRPSTGCGRASSQIGTGARPTTYASPPSFHGTPAAHTAALHSASAGKYLVTPVMTHRTGVQ